MGIVAHTCNFSTGEAEAGGSQVSGQPGLNSKILFQIINKKHKVNILLQMHISYRELASSL
jgi:hypothetical protein